MTLNKLKISLLCICIIISAGCGGGGGGGGGDNQDVAARVSIAVSPGAIDTGDRTTVTVLIEDLNESGAAIKIRFPVGLSYIIGTSELEVDGDVDAVAPTTNVADSDNGYLVYYFSDELKDNNQGTLTFKLLATAEVKAGQIEVDADLDDPAKDNQDEFDVETPNFAAQGADGIEVSA
jgi:hypothetical protein